MGQRMPESGWTVKVGAASEGLNQMLDRAGRVAPCQGPSPIRIGMILRIENTVGM